MPDRLPGTIGKPGASRGRRTANAAGRRRKMRERRGLRGGGTIFWRLRPADDGGFLATRRGRRCCRMATRRPAAVSVQLPGISRYLCNYSALILPSPPRGRGVGGEGGKPTTRRREVAFRSLGICATTRYLCKNPWAHRAARAHRDPGCVSPSSARSGSGLPLAERIVRAGLRGGNRILGLISRRFKAVFRPFLTGATCAWPRRTRRDASGRTSLPDPSARRRPARPETSGAPACDR